MTIRIGSNITNASSTQNLQVLRRPLVTRRLRFKIEAWTGRSALNLDEAGARDATE
jgi:hypothetical protein